MQVLTNHSTTGPAVKSYADSRSNAASHILALDLTGVMSDDFDIVGRTEDAIHKIALRLNVTFTSEQLDDVCQFTKTVNPNPGLNFLVDLVFAAALRRGSRSC